MVDEHSIQAQALPGAEYFPAGTLNQLITLTGLDAQQITNILGMINGPEQAKSEWWLTAEDEIIYSYAEDIGDGRGVTIGLYGATTGEDYRDADVVWQNYGHPEYGQLPQQKLIKQVQAIANDPKWWKSQWDAYISTYWAPTLGLLKPQGFRSALTIGALMDTAMNAGLNDDDSRHWGVKHLVKQAIANQPTEANFLGKFLELRLKYLTRDSGDMKKRVGAWQKLLRDNKWDMRIDLSQYCYIPR
ncbi:MAG: chitosanase [Acaryochloris sp. RU_4_1]|nr:chitosanase [Acaryochloris sp. RU_4_1]